MAKAHLSKFNYQKNIALLTLEVVIDKTRKEFRQMQRLYRKEKLDENFFLCNDGLSAKNCRTEIAKISKQYLF